MVLKFAVVVFVSVAAPTFLYNLLIDGAVMQGIPTNTSCVIDIADDNISFFPNETIYPPGQCLECSCYEMKKEKQFNYECRGCGVAYTDSPNCKIVTDLKAKHPKCCPKIVCNETINSPPLQPIKVNASSSSITTSEMKTDIGDNYDDTPDDQDDDDTLRT